MTSLRLPRVAPSAAPGGPSCMTVPQVISIRDDGTLGMGPVEELDSLRASACVSSASAGRCGG
jgi:hypothetical protein